MVEREESNFIQELGFLFFWNVIGRGGGCGGRGSSVPGCSPGGAGFDTVKWGNNERFSTSNGCPEKNI